MEEFFSRYLKPVLLAPRARLLYPKSKSAQDVYFGTAGKLVDQATDKITDPAYTRRVEKFLNELV
jgi:DNA-directed RNA polymerase subunit K/omega